MIVAYVAALSAGLMLAVYAMLHGVERSAGSLLEGTSGPRRFRFSLPALSAALTALGATGYVMARISSVGEPRRVVTALVAAAGAAVVSVLIVKPWTRAPSTELGDDPRFFLQGHPARVLTALRGSSLGEIAYEIDGARHATPARSTDGHPIAAGADVVIERIENGIAFVESWTEVEQRI